ncbi:MAG TPA: IclR family transcriptional regulator [Gaiellaceae bacterium]|nr:IclR family transcriptional regulator [Gaiellaceae bacterium]
MARTGQPSREHVASSGRALAILDLLAAEGPLGTNEIARRLGVTASTVSRQLGTLVDAGYAEHEPESGRYRPGLRLVHLANLVLVRLDVRTAARPHLEALVEATGETATLSVAGDPDAVTVDVVPGRHHVQGVTQLGRPSVAHATAAGKVALAFTGRRPAPPLRAYTARTIVDPGALEAELERVRRRGFAEACEEREPGLNAVAAPVFGADGGLAAVLALQGPVPRFGRASARAALPALLERASAISRELGATR